MILSKHPLSDCKVQTLGWDNLTEMVETVYIYPHKEGNHTYDFKTYLKDQILSTNSVKDREMKNDFSLPKSESYNFFNNLEKSQKLE